jgi:hypothetical protein
MLLLHPSCARALSANDDADEFQIAVADALGNNARG